MQYEMTCVRKHLLGSKTYYLQVCDDRMLLSDSKTHINPKYIVNLTQENRIMWKTRSDRLFSFGIFYFKRLKWFMADQDSLLNLKMLLAPRIFFGNISVFYDSLRIIGSGASSKVCLVKRKADLLFQAAKCISKKYCTESPDRLPRLQQEITMLQMIDHPNFIKLLEIYEGDNSYYIVTEYYEGDTLYSFIKNYAADTLPAYLIRDAMRTILIALQHLEQIQIVHRDIKLENILLGKMNDINSLKIIDFGLAIKQQNNVKLSICGTPGYISPEAWSKQGTYFTTKSDVFSAGVIFYKLLTKRTLFRSQNTNEIMELNKKCQVDYQDLSFHIQKETLCLLQSMLNCDPERRPLASECLQHKYFWCKLEEVNIIQEIMETRLSGLSKIENNKESRSVPDESQAAIVKRCPPTQYRIRIEQKKRTRSPRKYADYNMYLPSFCQQLQVESDGHSNSSSKMSKIIQEEVNQDEIIEENANGNTNKLNQIQ